MSLVSPFSGGAGFLGLHLARRALADGSAVRTLDVAPLDDPELERGVEEVRGDVRSERDARALVAGADVLVHAAAALPIQSSRAAIRAVNVEGTATVLAEALEAGVRRVVLISSTAVYGCRSATRFPRMPRSSGSAGTASPRSRPSSWRWSSVGEASTS